MESVALSDSTVKGLDLAAHDGGALCDTAAGRKGPKALWVHPLYNKWETPPSIA